MKYNFQTIKKTIVAFASCFTNIQIERYNIRNELEKTINVELVLANKSKSYKQDNSNPTNNIVGIVLPAISVAVVSKTYDIDRQTNNLSDIVKISKNDLDIIQHMKSPSPITITFEVALKSKYYKDALQLEEIIIPMFQPSLNKKVHLIPEMQISYEMPIILTGWESNFEFEFEEDVESHENYETILTFDVKSYIFPPIIDKEVVKRINMNTNGTISNIYDEFDTDNIVNDGLYSLTNMNFDSLQSFSFVASSDKDFFIHIEDISSTITSYGERLRIVDEYDNEIDFCYEYDNGELYSADFMVPPTLSILKTGNIYLRVNDIKQGNEYKFFVKRNNIEPFYIPSFMPLYADFNNRNFSYLQLENRKEYDYSYIDSNVLNNKVIGTTISDVCKTYYDKCIQGNKTYQIGLKNYTFEASRIICGLSNGENDYLYIESASTTNQFSVKTYANGTTILKGIITCSSLSTIKFIYDEQNDRFTIFLNNNSLVINSMNDFYKLFISYTGQNFLKVDYIKGY